MPDEYEIERMDPLKMEIGSAEEMLLKEMAAGMARPKPRAFLDGVDSDPWSYHPWTAPGQEAW